MLDDGATSRVHEQPTIQSCQYICLYIDYQDELILFTLLTAAAKAWYFVCAVANVALQLLNVLQLW